VAVGDAAGELVDVIAERASHIHVGPGRQPSSEMGPVITREAKERIVGVIDRSEGEGARLALDGRGLRVPGYEEGFFVGPTIVDEVRADMEVYREEIFGPVLAVLRVGTA
jgi:malonate-semialdehyde dehydrogenase (acetylating)/methylmalonate-semialdehyde dehydrogenase